MATIRYGRILDGHPSEFGGEYTYYFPRLGGGAGPVILADPCEKCKCTGNGRERRYGERVGWGRDRHYKCGACKGNGGFIRKHQVVEIEVVEELDRPF